MINLESDTNLLGNQSIKKEIQDQNGKVPAICGWGSRYIQHPKGFEELGRGKKEGPKHSKGNSMQNVPLLEI